MAAAFSTKYIDQGGTALHYLHTGPTTLPDVPPALDRGTLFVLLAPAGGSAGMWRRQMELLVEAGHSAVALDLPGHGRSAGLDAPPTVDACADVVAAVAEALGLRPFVLVGHSYGGTIALAFATRHGARLRGLVLLSCSAKPEIGAAIEQLRSVVQGRMPQQFSPELFSPQSTPDVMREFFTELVKTDPRVRLTDFEAAAGFDGRPLLGTVCVPTLVVAGADDRVTAPALTEALCRGIAGARFETVARAGHLAPQEQPEVVGRLLADFAAGTARP